jgi:hypothetical protein
MAVYVHPAYDPVDRIWYTNDGVTAESLAVLQGKLPEGAIILDYYPDGYGYTTRPRPPEVSKAPQDQRLRRTRYKSWREAYEATWSPPDEIPSSLPEPPAPLPQAVVEEPSPPPRQPIVRARKLRGPTLTPNVNWKLPDNRVKLEALVREGLSSKAISQQFDCSRNAIIGICSRLGYRLKQR